MRRTFKRTDGFVPIRVSLQPMQTARSPAVRLAWTNEADVSCKTPPHASADVQAVPPINRDWIACPARLSGRSFLYPFFDGLAQYQKSYRPNTYPNSQPLCMSFLQDRS